PVVPIPPAGAAPAPPPAPAPGDTPDTRVRLGSPGGAAAANPMPLGQAAPPGPVAPIPPLGAAPGVTSPPLVVPGGLPSAPQVESFDEETYRSRPGDTFETISQAKYLSPRFAQALLQFNRNHPFAAPGLLQTPPVLTPGQAVYIPPASVLQHR